MRDVPGIGGRASCAMFRELEVAHPARCSGEGRSDWSHRLPPSPNDVNLPEPNPSRQHRNPESGREQGVPKPTLRVALALRVSRDEQSGAERGRHRQGEGPKDKSRRGDPAPSESEAFEFFGRGAFVQGLRKLPLTSATMHGPSSKMMMLAMIAQPIKQTNSNG